MRLTATPDPIASLDASWMAVGLFDGETEPRSGLASSLVSELVATRDLTGSVGEATPLFGAGPEGCPVLVFGLGKLASFDAGSAYLSGVAVSKKLTAKPRSTVAVAAPSGEPRIVSAFVEGLLVGMIGPGIRKVDPTRQPFGALAVVAPAGADFPAFEAAVKRGEIVGECINLARELVNTPPSEKTPILLAQRAETAAKSAGLQVEVWDKDRLIAERFGGVLAVASGSAHPPTFVRLSYRNGGDTPVTALVGKGVTFDSGGLSLKPSASMEDMKCDMAGAATVLATACAAARLKIPANFDATFALTENMTGGAAMKLGDVLTIRNGLTVEVLNTDAEGRLVLADVLSEAVERKPSRIIDLATLTGACLVALGTKTAGLFANDDTVANAVLAAAKSTGERAWRMPMDDDFGDQIKSKVAEIKNTGGKWGGAITAAKFLQRFVDKTPWVHLDIAGPSWADDDSSTRDAGGTGCFVRTLVALLEA